MSFRGASAGINTNERKGVFTTDCRITRMGKEVAHLLVNPALTIHRKTLKLVFVALLLRYFLLSISAPVDATLFSLSVKSVKSVVNL